MYHKQHKLKIKIGNPEGEGGGGCYSNGSQQTALGPIWPSW
jgi:hypothetical protein